MRADVGPLVVIAFIAAVIVSITSLVTAGIVAADLRVNPISGALGGFGPGDALAGLLTFLVSLLVYAWALSVTYRIMVRRVRERRPADYEDLQDVGGAGHFLVATAVLGVLVGVGLLLLVVPGLVAITFWLYTLVLMSDHGMGFADAMTESRRLAQGAGYATTFGTWLVGALVVLVVGGVLSWIPVIGFVAGMLLMPFSVGYVVSMYFQTTGRGDLVEAAIG
jgi:hypothetical protein